MTDYHQKPPQTLPSFAWQEAKEKRKKLLEAVRQRRAGLYQRMRNRNKAVKPGFIEG